MTCCCTSLENKLATEFRAPWPTDPGSGLRSLFGRGVLPIGRCLASHWGRRRRELGIQILGDLARPARVAPSQFGRIQESFAIHARSQSVLEGAARPVLRVEVGVAAAGTLDGAEPDLAG